MPTRQKRWISLALNRKVLPRVSAWCILLLLPLPAGWAGVLRVGPDKPFKTIRAASLAVQDGDTVEIDSGIYSQDVATWRSNNVTVRGVGAGRAWMRADGVQEAGKGIWVIQTVNFTVENIEFSGAAVPDRNGAGVRAETTGTLLIRNCYFHDNENGILGPSYPDSELVIDSSIFERNGFGDGYSHNIYVGSIKSFRLQFSYSHGARVGHNLKSRARLNYVQYNRIMDEDSGTASYEIDLPQGGPSFIVGNLIQKGPLAENSSILSYATENANNGALELYVVNNTIVNDRPPGGTFLQLRPGTKLTSINNILYGTGVPWSTNGITVASDHDYIESSYTNSPRLADPKKFDYHLLADSPCRDAGISPGEANGVNLMPQSQYVYDAKGMVRPADGLIDVGAFEFQMPAPALVYFPHAVIGGGFSTYFTITNIGTATVSGSLILTDQSGNPLNVSLTGPALLPESAVSEDRIKAASSSCPVTVSPAASTVIVAVSPDASGPPKVGWARIESPAGGSLAGVATFQYLPGKDLQTIAGVLGSQPIEFATIPVDNDGSQNRFTGFAVANPYSEDMNISLLVVSQDGSIADSINPPELNPLGPQRQAARFLHEYLSSRIKFKGSVVLTAQGGKKFVATALVQNNGLYTAIPVIPARAPMAQPF